MLDNCSLIAYRKKRQLSVDEKSSVPTTQGRAFLMPGYPPIGENRRSEIDESIKRGFAEGNIICIEKDPNIAAALFEFYGDGPHIYEGTVVQHLTSYCKSKFCYIHLDFCSPLVDETAQSIDVCKDFMDKIARLRVSVSHTRNSSFESSLKEKLLITFLQSAQIMEREAECRNIDRWEHLLESSLVSQTESTQFIGTIFLLNHFFGLSYETYIDRCLDTPVFPGVQGAHFVNNMQRWKYNEETGHTPMRTIWVDLFPMHRGSIPSIDWVLDYTYAYMLQLNRSQEEV